ncbi:MAG: tRNA pseudouridine(13) synthase TruD [Acidilobaceae archaeon]
MNDSLYKLSVLNALKRLWGIEATLSNFSNRPEAALDPNRFRVFELPPSIATEEKGWRLYLVRKSGISTLTAMSKLRKALKARKVAFAGLKDAWGISYQYVSFMEPREESNYVDLGDVKAWLLEERGPLLLGSHSGNLFRVVLRSKEPKRVCNNLTMLKFVPGFYGPQRFGIIRPSSHIYGLRAAGREGGWLLREFAYRYPLEEKRAKLSYEVKALRESKERVDFWFSLKRVPLVAKDSLQSYLFNRALSRVIKKEGLERATEAEVTVRLGGATIRVSAARLPSRRLLKSRTLWAEVVREICEEEGIRLDMLRPKAPLRPLVFPIDVRLCRAGENEVEVVFCLPPSAYATVALMEIAEIDYLL